MLGCQLEGINCKGGIRMDRDLKDFQYSMRYLANRVYMIVVMSCIIIGLSFAVWGCATTKASELAKKNANDLTPIETKIIFKDDPEVNMEALPDPYERKELPVPEQVFSVWKHFPDEEIKPTYIARK